LSSDVLPPDDLSPNVLSGRLNSLFHPFSYTSPPIPYILPAVHSPLIFFSCPLIPFHNSFLSYQLFLLLPYFPPPMFHLLIMHIPFSPTSHLYMSSPYGLPGLLHVLLYCT
jgi:hypothetical protein